MQNCNIENAQINNNNVNCNIKDNINSTLDSPLDVNLDEAPIPEPPFGGSGAKIIEPKIKNFPDWTIEDFENALPHGWLYSNYYSNPFTYRRAIVKIDEYAQSVGYKGFRADMRDYVAEFGGKNRKNVPGTAYDGVTEWEGQPIQLNCGLYECNDNVGVYDGDNMLTVCHHPITLSKRLLNIDSGEVRLEIAYKRGTVWKTVIVEKTTLASARQIVEIARHGIAVNSENAKSMVKYFSQLEELNYDKLPESKSVSRLGWTSNNDFIPYKRSIEFEGLSGFRATFDSFAPTGDRDKWVSVASKVRSESIIARIVLAASFASVLVKPLHALPFFVHVWGESGNGKTMLLRLAASVWASPNSSDGYIRNFNSTIVGLETAADFFNSAPLCIDELQTIKNHRDFDDIVYILSEGQGRSRGTKDGSFARTKSWQNTIITTGEMPIYNAFSGMGAVSRVIDVSCGDEQLVRNFRELSDMLSHNWGFAGHEFIKGLTPSAIETAQTLQKQYCADLASAETTEKSALAASLLLAADELADQLVWHSGTALTVDEISKYLISKSDADINRRALDYLYGVISENAAKFAPHNDGYQHETWGSFRENGYGDESATAIIATVFNRILMEGGFSPEAFRNWAAKKGFIKKSPDGKTAIVTKINGRSTKCVWLYSDKNPDLVKLDNRFHVDNGTIC